MSRQPAVVALLLLTASAASAAEPAPGPAVPDWYCRSSALHMIRMAESALADNPDDARAPRRRGLLQEWRQRLAAGEPPCAVYRDIFEAAGDRF